MSIGNGQFIEYDGMKDNEGIEIISEYYSSYPKYIGSFELNKK
jgi:hypothetical protein